MLSLFYKEAKIENIQFYKDYTLQESFLCSFLACKGVFYAVFFQHKLLCLRLLHFSNGEAGLDLNNVLRQPALIKVTSISNLVSNHWIVKNFNKNSSFQSTIKLLFPLLITN